ncbi:MAG TPA: VWA domain-containing protein [Blastocatellia bacterium]|nr:VWA domain-containing protein [Blastocatellia bacterium]
MAWKFGYVIATIIIVVSARPIATLQARSGRPTPSTALISRQGPDSKQAPQNPQDKIVINTKLVNLTVSVNDKLGRFVAGLTKDDFEIFDDNIKQDVAFFSDDDAPISLGIVYDVSGSMGNFSSRSLAMLRYFFDNSHKEDEFYVYAFNNRVQLVQDFTSLPEALLNRVTFIKAKGSTALFDATYAAVEKIREGRHHKKVILIFSDGEENSSRYSGRELQNLLKENDVQIYAIGMSEISNGAGTLKFIAEPTGGQALFPFDYASAEVVYTRLALMLRRQYVIGFYPSNVTSGTTWHKLNVQIKAPKQLGKLKLSYKNGYWMTR